MSQQQKKKKEEEEKKRKKKVCQIWSETGVHVQVSIHDNSSKFVHKFKKQK